MRKKIFEKLEFKLRIRIPKDNLFPTYPAKGQRSTKFRCAFGSVDNNKWWVISVQVQHEISRREGSGKGRAQIFPTPKFWRNLNFLIYLELLTIILNVFWIVFNLVQMVKSVMRICPCFRSVGPSVSKCVYFNFLCWVKSADFDVSHFEKFSRCTIKFLNY